MHWIKNFDQLAKTRLRKDALQIAEAGLDAIDTQKIIAKNVFLRGKLLQIKDQVFNLADFKTIKVIGFGKASCTAAFALEQILGPLISQGIAIGAQTVACEYIQTYQGTHPLPSDYNTKISHEIYKLSQDATAEDLVLVVVSGGGSSLLCWPQDECVQGKLLYEAFLSSGGTIEELNIVRKHISLLKGGGLAKALYPATVAALIFSDIPGGHFESIASGPTYKDTSTKEDAAKLIEKYKLGTFRLLETPKEDKYFEKVSNIPIMSNIDALNTMEQEAQKLGYTTKILSSQSFDNAQTILKQIKTASTKYSAVFVGGEPQLIVTKKGGKGGRNQQSALIALKYVSESELFLSLASDGVDNSDAAGAIADEVNKKQAQKLGLDFETFLDNFDGYNYFEKTNNQIITGPTGTNVSDLMFMLRKL
jgi:glycerate-2-kinase